MYALLQYTLQQVVIGSVLALACICLWCLILAFGRKIFECALWKLPKGHVAVLLLGSACAICWAQKVRYVDANARGLNNGLNWDNAFTNIQPAVDTMYVSGGAVLVRPGKYGTVFRNSDAYFRNGWLNSVYIVSTDGPDVTIIEPDVENEDDRFWTLATCCGPCLGIVPPESTVVRGFTVRNAGAASMFVMLENCVVSNMFCAVGDYGAFKNCLIVRNRADSNYRYVFSGCKLFNCTVVGNDSDSYWDGGCLDYYSSAVNCIIWGNTWQVTNTVNYLGMALTNCCTYPLLPGDGNICADPRFAYVAGGDYRLRWDSPCRDAGSTNLNLPSDDLEGAPRVQNRYVDMGCYEMNPVATPRRETGGVPVEFDWLLRYGLVDADAESLDYSLAAQMLSANIRDATATNDVDRYYSVWESYLAGLDPTDSNHVFRANIAISDGIPVVTPDPYLSNRVYTVWGKETITNLEWTVDCTNAHFYKIQVAFP